MPFRFLADENLKDAIVIGLWQRSPELEVLRVREEGLDGAGDPEILAWAAQYDCIILTHDVSTMTAHAYERVRQGEKMSGVFIVPDVLGIGPAVEDLLLIAECSTPGEWEGKVQYIPL